MSPTALALAHPAQNQPIWFQECRVGIAMEITMAGGAVEGIIMVISPHNVGIGIYNIYIYWLVVSIPLTNMKVSWDDSSQYMEKKHVPNHQPVYIYILWLGVGIGRWFLPIYYITTYIYIYNPYNYGCSCISIYNWNCTSKHPNPLT